MSVDSTLARNGGLSYLEIPAVDLRRAAEFYASVLGWRVDESNADRPKFSDQSGHLIGRWCAGRPVSREPGLMAYFYVDGIRAAAGRVAAAGGEVVRAPTIEGDTVVATVRDPSGNLIGLWEEAR